VRSAGGASTSSSYCSTIGSACAASSSLSWKNGRLAQPPSASESIDHQSARSDAAPTVI
jgi:hypothetical protein